MKARARFFNKPVLKSPFYLLLAFGLFSPSVLAQVLIPEFPSKNKPLSVKLQTEFFRSHSNYTSFGSYVDLPSENSFQYFGFHPSIRYAPFSHYIDFEIFAKSFYASSITKTQKRDVFRPTVVGAGFRAFYTIKQLYIGFEMKGGYPLYGNFRTPDEVVLDSDSLFMEPGLWLLLNPSEMFYLFYNSAFQYRMTSLSSLWFNRLGGAFQTQYIDVGLAFDSFFPALADEFSSQPEQRWEALNKVNGGSQKFYSVNPSVLSFTSWVDIKFYPLFATLYMNIDTLGQNYGRGFTLGIITKWQWNTKSSFIKKRKNMDFHFEENNFKHTPQKDNKYFKEEEDSYNESEINIELKNELKNLKY